MRIVEYDAAANQTMSRSKRLERLDIAHEYMKILIAQAIQSGADADLEPDYYAAKAFAYADNLLAMDSQKDD